jgi:hypothetical protein
LPLSSGPPTHLYYFATPFIFSGTRGVFSTRLFAAFCDYYVTAFINTVNRFGTSQLSGVFYPSTVAIDEIPANMGEYAAAKAAGEIACVFLEKQRGSITVYRPRLPRMATDQTASLTPVKNLDPLPPMLEHLRSFRDNWKARTQGKSAGL